MATAKKSKIKEFDEAVLQTLVEPITITLEKIVSGQKSPIELPPGPGETIGGKGYTADMVRTLPSFISNRWTGGGMYHCVATGTNAEQMKWDMFFPPQKFAEITPPTQTNSPGQLGGAAVPVAPAAPVADTSGYLAQVAQTYLPVGNAAPPQALYRGNGVIPPSPLPWAQPQMQGMAPMQPMAPLPPAVNPYAAAAKEREERMKLEAKMDRQAQDAQHEKANAAITQELRRLQEGQASRPAAEESSALKSANEKIAALEQQGSTQMLLAQMQNMQNSTNQMFEKMQANTDRQIEAIRRESESNKGDQTLPMMMQMMTQQATSQQQSMQVFMQAMQSNQQSQTEQARLSQANQMTPRELVDIYRSANSGTDKMAEGYSKMQELMFSNMDAFMQAQGPAMHPAIPIIENTIGGAVESIQGYIKMKESETQANAQAQAIRAQVEAQSRVQTAKIQADAAVAVAAPKSSVIDNPDQIEGGDTEDPSDETGVEEEVSAEAEAVAAAASITEQVRAKEVDLFGEAMEPIMRLRKGVETGALDSAKIAAFVLQAVDHVEKEAREQEGKEIPPVFELFKEERYADLIDVLLPDSNPQFREEVTGALYAGVTTMKNHPQVNSSPPEAQPTA